jgi:hypothetical protein
MTERQDDKLKKLLVEYYIKKYGYYLTKIEKVIKKVSLKEFAEEKEREEQELINWLYKKMFRFTKLIASEPD